MSRAARLLAGATLVGVSACSSTEIEPAPVPVYGAPIPVVDAAAADSGAGGAGGAPSNDAAADRNVITHYGGPPIDVDAGG